MGSRSDSPHNDRLWRAVTVALLTCLLVVPLANCQNHTAAAAEVGATSADVGHDIPGHDHLPFTLHAGHAHECAPPSTGARVPTSHVRDANATSGSPDVTRQAGTTLILSAFAVRPKSTDPPRGTSGRVHLLEKGVSRI